MYVGHYWYFVIPTYDVTFFQNSVRLCLYTCLSSQSYHQRSSWWHVSWSDENLRTLSWSLMRGSKAKLQDTCWQVNILSVFFCERGFVCWCVIRMQPLSVYSLEFCLSFWSSITTWGEQIPEYHLAVTVFFH